ncbi:MAG TPA: protein kinase family protein [Pseudonocardiaceae bacterium]|nr:protein kinase family protein [Pseudonocardiaceae bacterium]
MSNVLLPGGVVGDGRYRLLAQFGEDSRANAQFWRGRDGQLNRDVALTVLIGDPADSTAAVGAGRTLERAMHAANFAHPGVARVLDVLSLGSGIVPSEGILGMIVAEWTHGTDLIDVVSDGPVPSATASRLLEPLAAAVESAHHVGLVLGVDHPQRVRVTPDGALKLAFPGPLPMATLRDDVKGLGALLYLLLTGRWALRGGPSAVPGAPTGPDGSVVAPNILHANVPPELSSIAVRSLEDTAVGGIRTSAAILQVLDAVAEEEAATALIPAIDASNRSTKDDAVWITKKPVQNRQQRRKLTAWFTVVAVLTLAIVVWVVTSVIGFFSTSSTSGQGGGPPVASTQTSSASASSAPATSSTAAVGAAVTPASITEFNIKGSDNPSKAKLAIDGNPSTSWKTDIYQQQFPTYKPGIGLMATFSQPVKLAQVVINSPSAGTVVEIHTCDSAHPSDLSQTQVVGTGTLVNGQAIINLNQSQPSQYILVWVTQLATSGGGGFESAISEITYNQAQ